MITVIPRAACSRTVPRSSSSEGMLNSPRFLSASKGCFLEAEPMAGLTPPCPFYTFHLPPSNLFFLGGELRTS